MDWPTAVAIIALAFTAAVIQSLSGFGFALFIVPFLAILIVLTIRPEGLLGRRG